MPEPSHTAVPTRYAVIGHPVSHSRSPWIHARFAAATAQNLRYEAIDAAPERFEETVRAFLANGGHGFNVTVPHKLAAFELADALAPAAREAGAVNTLRLEPDGRILGDNTDGVGLVRDLRQNLGVELAGSRILLLGAGGAARGALGPLLRERPERLRIVNRTAARARELVSIFGHEPALAGGGVEILSEEPAFDLIINATAAGLAGETLTLPPGNVGPASFCYDMLYAAGPTPFVAWARAAGAGGTADGVGMLVEQAAESFYIWRGVRPPTGDVLAELKHRLQS